MTLNEILKEIMHASHHVSIWWFIEICGTVPLRVGCCSVLSSLSQSSHWQLGLLPVQWRGNRTGCLKGRRGGKVLHRLGLEITRQSTAAIWWGLQKGIMDWGGSLLSPGLPCLQQKPAEQHVRNQNIHLIQKQENLHSSVLSSKFLTSNHKSKANCVTSPYLYYYRLTTGEVTQVSWEYEVHITSKGSAVNWAVSQLGTAVVCEQRPA